MSTEKCATCGRPLQSATCSYCSERAVSRILRRQIVNLIVLAAGAAALFLFTREMARRNRAMHESVAESWYAIGEKQLAAGDWNDAIQSLRQASTNNHDNSQYTLVLAKALAAGNRDDEARQSLLRLRESRPEDAEINLSLARLDAKRGDVTEAKRYYHNALYGVWPPSAPDSDRRAVELELIRFLLDHRDPDDATSELLIFERDLPETRDAHLQTADLFLQAGDSRRALNHYQLALKKAPRDSGVLAGAAEASFELQDYAAAARYITAAGDGASNSDRLRPATRYTVRAILENDPFASQLSADTRRQRTSVVLNQAWGRLSVCAPQQGQDHDFENLNREVQSIEDKLKGKADRGNLDVLRDALNLAYRIEAATPQSCGAPSPLDRAVVLLARKYGVAEP